MRGFLDANILFSAADKKSATRQLLEGVCRHAEAVSSLYALEEARRNLSLKRAVFVGELSNLEKKIRIVQAFAPLPPIKLPEDDLPILAGAVASGCTHLWTSDRRHFGSHYGQEIQGVRVVSSVMLAEVLMKKGWRPSSR